MKLRKIAAMFLTGIMLMGSCLTASATEIPQETCTVKYEKTSSAVNVSTKMEGDTAVIDLEITAEAEGDQVLAISDILMEMNSLTYMPGGTQNIKVNITNHSGHLYQYKAGSFVLAPPDVDETFGTLESGALLPVLGYDGQYLALVNVGSMLPKYFYKDIFGVSRETQVTFEMMCGIYDALAQKGYASLSEYLADLYGYDSWEDLVADKDNLSNTMFSSCNAKNGIYSVTEEQLNAMVEKYPWLNQYLYVTVGSNDQLKAQIKWPEEEIAAFTHDYFYSRLFFFVYGEENLGKLNPNYDRTVTPIGICNAYTLSHTVADYLQGKAAFAEADSYFENLITMDSFADGSSVSFDMAFALNGPEMNNQYQKYKFGYYNAITLERVDGDLTVNKVDENGAAVDGAQFVVGKTTADGAVYLSNGQWVTDKAAASVFVSQNGSFVVADLPYGQYFLEEIAAPEGYEGAEGTIAFTVDRPEVSVTVVNTTLEEIPEESTPSTPPTSSGTEEIPDEDTPSGSPETGEGNNPIWIVMAVAFLSLCASAVVLSRKKETCAK